MPAPADREKALEAALAQIDRSFGKGSVMRLGEEGRAPVEVIPTGSIALELSVIHISEPYTQEAHAYAAG